MQGNCFEASGQVTIEYEGIFMDIKKILDPKFYILHLSEYKESIKNDEFAFSTFREGNGILSKKEKKSIEFKAVKCYRLYQANFDTVWRYFFAIFCHKYTKKYGIEIYPNMSIGKGFVIGHWGRIIISGDAKLGEQLMVTHGVTIGRDIRGKRKGVPTIGNRVAIRANSTVVGNVTIGDDVIIAPNTFVNFDVPSNSVVIGNPAKVISKENASEGHVGKLPCSNK